MILKSNGGWWSYEMPQPYHRTFLKYNHQDILTYMLFRHYCFLRQTSHHLQSSFSQFGGGSILSSSTAQPCLTLCDPMYYSTPGFPVHHQLPETAQTQVHRVGDTIQPPHPLLSPSPPAFNLSQHQGFFQWLSSLQQVAKVLEFQHQHQSFQ